MSEMAEHRMLQRIAEIKILDQFYDLARNGGSFHLVEQREPDAYLRPVARRVDLAEWIEVEKAQALLNLLGESYQENERLSNELEKAHQALQREAEPNAKPRPKAQVRETSQGIAGILEGKAGDE